MYKNQVNAFRASLVVSISVCLFCLISVNFAFAESEVNKGNYFSKYQPYAVLANVAYQTPEDIHRTVDKNGWRVSHYETIPGIEVLYFIATHEQKKEQIVVVRGTANVENAMVDLAHKLQPNQSLKVKLHEGFGVAGEKLYNAAKPHLQKNAKISTTGHSLGGAVALIVAMYLQIDGYVLNNVVTFGQPKVTNLSGTVEYKNLNIIRFVTPKDLVPLVPPFDAMDVNNLDIYWHLGTEYILLPGEEYSEVSGVESMLRAATIISEKIDSQNVEHHRMDLYLRLINAKIKNAIKVKHKNFNLLKLFSGG